MPLCNSFGKTVRSGIDRGYAYLSSCRLSSLLIHHPDGLIRDRRQATKQSRCFVSEWWWWWWCAYETRPFFRQLRYAVKVRVHVSLVSGSRRWIAYLLSNNLFYVSHVGDSVRTWYLVHWHDLPREPTSQSRCGHRRPAHGAPPVSIPSLQQSSRAAAGHLQHH